MTNALAPRVPTMTTNALEDPERLGTLLAASGYFSDTRDAAQAVVKVLAGAELGFGPIASMTGVNIIKGRVSMSAFLMAATVKRHPKYDYKRREHSDQLAAIEFFENGESLGISEFTIEDARKAKLLSSDNWQKYPSNMLFWRAMSNGAKMLCPDAFAGAPVYTPDELGADVDPVTGDFIDAAPAPTPQPPAPIREPTPIPAPTRADKLEENDVALRREGATNGKGGAPASPPATSSPADDRAPSSAPPDPPARTTVTAEDVEAFMRMTQVHGIPDNLWRAALLVNDVERLEDLPRPEFDALVGRITERAARS